MISFRFYLVSLIAVFLSLAVGIVVGTTLVDRAVVAGLRNRVDAVSGSLDERQAANDQLQGVVDRLDDFASTTSPYLVEDRLDGRIVVIIADAGVSDGPVQDVAEVIGLAGGDVRGVVRLQPEWALTDAEDRRALAEATSTSAGTAAAMQDRAARLLVADLSSTVEVAGDGTGALDEIGSAGLLEYEAGADAVADDGVPVLFVFVTGSRSLLEGGSHLPALARAAVATGASAIVAEVHDPDLADGPARGELLETVRSDEDLADAVSTIDSLDLREGPIALVLTLGLAVDGDAGHYGYGGGADSPVPSFEPPS